MTVIVRDLPGELRRGTILGYNGDGTVLVGLDERQTSQYPQQYNVPVPVAWSGPKGEIIAVVDDQTVSWNAACGEIKQDTKKAKEILKHLKGIGLL